MRDLKQMLSLLSMQGTASFISMLPRLCWNVKTDFYVEAENSDSLGNSQELTVGSVKGAYNVSLIKFHF